MSDLQAALVHTAVKHFLARRATPLSVNLGRNTIEVTPWGMTLCRGVVPILARLRTIRGDGNNNPLPSIMFRSQALPPSLSIHVALAFETLLHAVRMPTDQAAALARENWTHHYFDGADQGAPLGLSHKGRPLLERYVIADDITCLVLDAKYAPSWRQRYEKHLNKRRSESLLGDRAL